jgi:sulfate adenylyltransferase large subunit
MDLLHFATAGSVDDGKSTLIGRLLYESKSLYADQLEEVEKISKERGFSQTEFALLVDGLKDEHEQGITVDVAYRYFSGRNRRFVIHDCPGHVQHTRNYVTGISKVNLVLLVVDARKGITEQTKRHATIASLVGVPHLMLCVNKMDLVNYSQEVFEAIKGEFFDFSAKLEIPDVRAIPISALRGENITSHSLEMPWYDGPFLLNFLEELYVRTDYNLRDLRAVVSLTIRPREAQNADFRGFALNVLSGELRKGEQITVLPSGFNASVEKIFIGSKEVDSVMPLQSPVITLSDDLDVTRGDIIVRPNNKPMGGQKVSAMIASLSKTPIKAGQKFYFKHLATTGKAVIERVHYVIDVNSLHRIESSEIKLNDIARIDLHLSKPIFFDPYKVNRLTGSMILIDPVHYDTIGACMIRSGL